MVKVKVCGITSFKDALAAVAAGADALGFVFYRKSPRYITPVRAQGITQLIPERIMKVGVFVNAPHERVKKIARQCGLDMLQLHGEESPAYCGSFKGYKVIKAFRMRPGSDTSALSRYRTYAWLFDSFDRSRRGGTGRAFDWKLLRSLKPGRRVFLSGGLNPANVGRAVRLIKPAWVDVSSSVESAPGKKDYGKLKKFIRSAKQKG